MEFKNSVHPTKKQMEGFLEGDSETPISMINLLKFKEKAEYEDGRDTDLTGEQAYTIYSEEVIEHLKKVGGEVSFGGSINRLMLGEVEELWDKAFIVKYPSKKAMLKMVTDPDYLESNKHREAGLAGQLNIEVKE
ncbi:DUF1330 domain-containing protein [Gammaproteobacteria bacterium]|nr:DUF1330 domain-containing protein [Gammaproteobacteria bacterium]MDA7844116.1 DUF1330 domain-containing protein [Gammaproteobacteria bacterium]MDA9102231.1 DUF1330 domain-containing protein [Gammaproteobacteria bacterium]